MNNIKVSVVVPVYNTEKFLKQCLNSLINQTLKELQIIIVNDGSTDNSQKIIEDFEKKYDNILVIKKTNGGLASAYNAGIRRATGEYIGFLDSDDWADTNMFAELYAYGKNFDVDVVRSGGIWAEENHRKPKLNIMIPADKCRKVITNSLYIPEFVGKHVAQWSSIYKRSFLQKNRIFCPETPKGLAPDIDFIYQVWILAKSFYIVPKAFVHYRLDNPDSDKKTGTKMSIYLLKGHLAAQKSLFKLGNRVTPLHWQRKIRVEFSHLNFEINVRSKKNKLKLLIGISKLYKNNIKKGLANRSLFSAEEWFRYRFIANFPRLFWLADLTKFYKTTGDEEKIIYRLGGIYKLVISENYEDYFFFGLKFSHAEYHNEEIRALHEKIDHLNYKISEIKTFLDGYNDIQNI